MPQLACTTQCPHVTIATSRPPTAWWQVCWVAWLFVFVRAHFRSLNSKHESVLWVIAINATLQVSVWLFDDDSIGFLSPAQEMLSASISQTRILQTCSVPHNMVNGANSLQGTDSRTEHEWSLFYFIFFKWKKMLILAMASLMCNKWEIQYSCSLLDKTMTETMKPRTWT